ncbi:hypothetical protein FA95DRAFT_622209 [Auriscalpium vulgare]|uniref:Uncharacterized protein n=1 Tax=Auriscalpium vulgare TaxID=40419 RepID=A0ACB8S312_9AGAM|nr:hypothetical protein FA95DRAFT_622209 [Auriscalpium vulgare]
MTALRQRLPFSNDEDRVNESEFRVLDEEEQEEVIDTLRAQDAESNKLLVVLMRAVIGSSILLHVIYLVRNENPINAFLAPTPPIPYTHLFSAINLAALANLLAKTWHAHPALQHVPLAPHILMYATAAAAPVFCLVRGSGLTDVVWWSVALVTVGFQHLLHRSIASVETEIEKLESLKYNAKGA